MENVWAPNFCLSAWHSLAPKIIFAGCRNLENLLLRDFISNCECTLKEILLRVTSDNFFPLQVWTGHLKVNLHRLLSVPWHKWFFTILFYQQAILKSSRICMFFRNNGKGTQDRHILPGLYEKISTTATLVISFEFCKNTAIQCYFSVWSGALTNYKAALQLLKAPPFHS